MTQPKHKAVEGFSPELVTELAANYKEVDLKILRRNDRGHVQTVYGSLVKAVEELSDLDGWLQQVAGGGKYEIEVRRVGETTTWVVPGRVSVFVEGLPKPPAFLGGATAAFPGGGDMSGMDRGGGEPPSQWAMGLHPSQRGGFGPAAPTARYSSDQVAMKQLSETQQQLVTLKAELERERERAAAERERAREQVAAAERSAAEARHQAQMRALEQKIEMFAMNKPQGPSSMDSIVALLTATAPLLMAFVTSSKDAQAKAMELQHNGVTTLMQATLAQSKPNDSWKELLMVVGPLVIPLVQQMVSRGGPEAQMALYSSVMENNLNSTAMMAQLIEGFANAGGDDPWYVPMIKETMQGIVTMTDAYMRAQQEQQQAAVATRQQTGKLLGETATRAVQVLTAQPAPVYQTEAPTVLPPTRVANTQQEQQQEPPAADGPTLATTMDSLGLSAPERVLVGRLPERYQTEGWISIVVNLHRLVPAEELAEELAGHLEDCLESQTLPDELLDIQTDPAAALSRLVAPLPVASKQEYVREVLQLTIDMLREDRYLAEPSLMAEEDDDEAPAEAENGGLTRRVG